MKEMKSHVSMDFQMERIITCPTFPPSWKPID